MITKIDPINIWKLHSEDPLAYVCIPTNLSIRGGRNVMGAGLARDTNVRFSSFQLPDVLGRIITAQKMGDGEAKGVVIFDTLRIITFPTKNEFSDNRADLGLIHASAMELVRQITERESTKEDWGMEHPKNRHHIYLPAVGCGLGNLQFAEVARVLDNILSSPRYILIRPFTELKHDVRLISDEEYDARERELANAETA